MHTRFKDARRKLNITQQQCAELLCVSLTTVKRYESNKPNTTALLYIELLSGDLRCFGRKWNGFFISLDDGKISDGHNTFYPSAYYAIRLHEQTVKFQQREIKQLKNNYQMDLFSLDAPE